ncbi:MAG: hypothetical protein ACI4KH_08965 [Oscillospiraceae bacterium]
MIVDYLLDFFGIDIAEEITTFSQAFYIFLRLALGCGVVGLFFNFITKVCKSINNRGMF